MKTETLYRPITSEASRIIENAIRVTGNFEPVTVHVAGDLYRQVPVFTKGSLADYVTYEKVTHVLPDQFRDDTKEINKLTLKLGELIYDKIGLQKKIEELGKELDSWKRIPANEGRVMRETIESQKRELESLQWEYQKKCGYADQSKEIDRLKSELAAFKAVSKLADDVIFRQKNDEISRLKKELEEAKNGGVKWVKNFCSENKVVEYEKYERKLSVFWDGMNCIIPKPQLRTLDDEAQEAYEKLSYEPRNSRMMFQEGFNAGFKSAKEIK